MFELFKAARNVTFLVLCLIGLGWLLGVSFEFATLGLSLALVYFLANLFRLKKWLKLDTQPDEQLELPGTLGLLALAITKLRKKENKAKKSLQHIILRAQKSLAALKDGVVLVDNQGVLEWWNTAAEQLLGLQQGQDEASYVTNLIRDPDFVEYLNQNDYKHPFSLRMPHNNNVVEIQITHFGEGEKLLVVRDISRIENLEKMRTEFIANVSHELKTPLTVINGYLETLLMVTDQFPERLQKSFTSMDHQSKRMMNLIEDLMLLSTLETTEQKVSQSPIRVASLVRTLCEEMDVLKNHSQSIEVDLDEMVSLIGKRSEIYSAIANLFTNAIKYSGDDACVKITWGCHEHGATLIVEDNGVGIEPELLPRLTERFFRVESSRNSETGGSGIGLAIVKHVLIRHEANLEIESEIGQGTRFICTFPPYRLVHKSVKKVS